MRLLIAEDFEPLRRSLVRGLEDQGYAIDATGTGKEALWYATGTPYDTIILDIMLPEMSGLEVLQSLRRSGSLVPVLLLTARDQLEDKVEGLDHGADDYLTKPFQVAELLARVRALTRRAHQRRDPVVRVGDLTLDTTTKVVTRGDATLLLTPKEFALCEYLALRSGTTVSRTEIEEHIYAFTDESSSNVVDAAIMRLRRKLSPEGQPQLIHTRRGFGYIMASQDPGT